MFEVINVVVILFLLISISILFLFFINQLRITQISPTHLYSWLKWYALCLVLYYVLSSNQYYFERASSFMLDAVNLSILIIISFGMMIYVHQYCIERERENKLKELAIAYALLKKDEQDRQDELLEKE